MADAKAKKAQEKSDELVEKFVELRRKALKNGLSETVIEKSFRDGELSLTSNIRELIRTHYDTVSDFVRNLSWKRIQSQPSIAIQILVAVIAVCVGVYSMHPIEMTKDYVYSSKCIVDSNAIFAEVTRPVVDCSMCEGLTSVTIERNMTTEAFISKYAYSGVPVLVKDATSNWTAMDKFSFHYFRDLYLKTKGSLRTTEEECQFFPYKTDFNSLREVFNMSEARATFQPGEKEWYIGWSNCDPRVAEALRESYQRPYFLPNDSESSALDWIFMGGTGEGANLHLDFVMRPSWQAQISGAKTWTLVPPPECEKVCNNLAVTVEKGDIVIIDTNKWYHSTFVQPGEMSITIGSEYD